MKFVDQFSAFRRKYSLSLNIVSDKTGIDLKTLLVYESGQEIPEEEIQKKIFSCANEGFSCNFAPKPDFSMQFSWESYAADLMVEYRQSVEEGKDIQKYEDLFSAAAKMEASEEKDRIADVLFDVVTKANIREGYQYIEPDDLPSIRALRNRPEEAEKKQAPQGEELYDKIYGAWLGRIAGCLLGKTVEGIHTNELHPLLKASGNFPMHRYILSTDVTDEIAENTKYPLRTRCYADKIEAMPVDDDTNYVVLAQVVVDKCGSDFTSEDVMRAWIEYQSKNAYCTAERVAYVNFVKGFRPPFSARYKNPYREWIGAQIRGDYFGYINPGNPEKAAEMAWRDASISHIKNGIYGEMFAAAMIAEAAVETGIEKIILAGLNEIPKTSRLHEAISEIISDWKKGMSREAAFSGIHARWNEHNSHDWCHTISNAEIVAAALLYGKGDFGASICMAVETGFDTDCNGATVGSILGMRNGAWSIDPEWVKPFNDQLDTSIFGVGRVKLSEMARKTIGHIER
ncbi:MAG: ADP-ribosylglycohydrolase family protein [Clostridia bacterium]|nr:ADP-ribosylglycohydrolase family protein [Clostridia bacterium]